MQTLQIPPVDPVDSGRPARDPAQGDLFDSRGWESAYQQEVVPVLLVQLQDDLSRARMREAFWISVIVHLIVVIALWNSPALSSFLMRLFPRSAIALSPNMAMRDKDTTFLALPPDAEKITKPPNTDKLSDKNRIAQTRKPHLDPKELRKILDASRAGAPGPGGVPAPKPEPAPPQAAQNAGPPAQRQGAPPAQTNQMAKLTPPMSPKNVFTMGGTAGSAIESAARAAAANRGAYGGGSGGDYGLGQGRAATDVVSNLDVLSDTQGVDFGPYLAHVLYDVKRNWYNLIPEVARAPIMKKGTVSIEFAITKQGQVAGMRLVSPSGDVSLDRAAWGGITASNPFQPLPKEFNGQYLALRFHFYYNPDKNDLQ